MSRIRRAAERANLLEHFAAENLALDCKASPLVIVEEDTFLAELLLEDLVLRDQVFDDALLLTIDPPGQGEQLLL